MVSKFDRKCSKNFSGICLHCVIFGYGDFLKEIRKWQVEFTVDGHGYVIYSKICLCGHLLAPPSRFCCRWISPKWKSSKLETTLALCWG